MSTPHPTSLVEHERRVLTEVARGVPLGHALDELLRAVEEQTSDGMRTSILIVSEDGRHLRHGAAPSLPAAYTEAIDGIAIGEGVGSCGTAMSRAAPVYVDDIKSDPLWADFRELALSHNLRACWSTPIPGVDGTLLGTFAIYYAQPRSPTDADLDIIAFVSHTAGLAIEQFQTARELRQQKDELHATKLERERVEAALRDSEARLDASETSWRGLFERLNEGFMVVEIVRDPAGVARTWRFKEINAAWGRISGLDPAAARGRNVDDVIPGVEQHWLDSYIRVAETGEPLATRMPLAALGQLYDVRASRIATDEVAVLFQEVSDEQRKDIRRASLLALHDRLRDLDDPVEVGFAAAEVMGGALGVGRAGYATLSTDGSTLLIERDWTGPDCPSAAGLHQLSDYGEAILGIHESDTVAIDDVTTDPRTSASAASFEAVRTRALVNLPLLENGQVVALFFVNASQPRRWADEEISFIRNVAELTRSAIQRRRAEAELRHLAASLERQVEERTRELAETQAALLQSQKMEAMGSLTGGVAHDFNNLLTPIIGSLDLLQRRSFGGEREKRLIAGAVQSADRARTLVQRLLAFARRQPLQPIAVDVGRLIEGMAGLLASTTGPQVRVIVEASEDLPPANADPNQLEMALLNLGLNARDAMPDGGVLRISAIRKRIREACGPLKRGDYVQLSVSDTGIGMDEPTLARAIEPFFSTKGIGRGTGLGLSMAHGLAAQLGGALEIQSRPGAGTNVDIWLPISAAALHIKGTAAPPAALGSARGVVLLVDDEETVRASTADMLEELGYEVRETDSGEAAKTLVAQGLVPDLLVTDHLMPGMTGVELARKLRVAMPDLPVLVVSGYAEVEGLAVDLPRLTKPFKSAELGECLAALAVNP